jgi:hypothetical protein
VFIAQSYSSLNALILDLSLTGVGLLLNRPLELGSWILLELDGLGHDLGLEVSAQVVHATPQHDGNYLIGCAFAHRLSADELDALL